jgi:hypothetical protein
MKIWHADNTDTTDFTRIGISFLADKKSAKSAKSALKYGTQTLQFHADKTVTI